MSTTLDMSEPSSPQSFLVEPDTPGPMNRACLLDDSKFLVDGSDDCNDLSSVTVPETPSPLCLRRRVHLYGARTDTGPLPLNVETTCKSDDNVLCTTPTSHQKCKRRRIVEETSCSEVEKPKSCGSNDFVPASKFMETYAPWLEVPRPSPSFASASTSASSSLSQSGPSGSHAGLLNLAACHSKMGLATDPTEQPSTRRTSRKRERPTRSATSTISSSPSKCHLKTTDVGVFQPHTGTSHCRVSALESMSRSVPPLPQQKQEEIVIIDDDEDDVIVEAMVRSVQMAEDEAFARSLQEQFDREEQQQQMEQRRQQAMHSERYHPNHRYDPYRGMGWMPAWSQMGSAPGLAYVSPTLAELQQAMFAELPGRHPGNRMNSRPRSRSRRQPQHLPLDLLNDSQGNNYEALLAFEEGQGSAMPKNVLSKREIERLPTKAYNPVHSAGKTECQICFCEYTEGEQLRMLPCLHDYHVKCIDRWLKENVTCPICRADVSQTSN